MRELSLHILDLIQNSIVAEATTIKLEIKEDSAKDLLFIIIEDDGVGMDKDLQKKVLDPFVTSRTTRKVGLGLPLFKAAAERCEGSLELESEPGVGTKVETVFKASHIDRAPLGDIVGTITTILSSDPEFELIYKHQVKDNQFEFKTSEIRAELEDVSINNPEILTWIGQYLEENINNLYGGE